VFTGSVTLRRSNFALAQAMCEHKFIPQIGEDLMCHSFYMDDQKILKVFAALSLGLIYALVTLAIPAFLVTMSLKMQLQLN
jgi:hypothetical protein